MEGGEAELSEWLCRFPWASELLSISVLQFP